MIGLSFQNLSFLNEAPPAGPILEHKKILILVVFNIIDLSKKLIYVTVYQLYII